MATNIRGVDMNLEETQINRWRILKDEFQSDAEAASRFDCLIRRREKERVEILALLESFLNGGINASEMRTVFDQKTRTDWIEFGLKGLSGGMFLNKCVKHLSNQPALNEELRSALKVPDDEGKGRLQMSQFVRFLADMISSGKVTKNQIQPARASFFLGAFWHLQSPELWPIFYPATRELFAQEGIYNPSRDPVEDYFVFHDCFLSLSKALKLKSWELEQLCWYHKQKGTINTIGQTTEQHHVLEPIDSQNNEQEVDVEEEVAEVSSRHTEIQLLLAKIGRRFGYSVWIAANDRGKECKGEKLGGLSLATLPNLGMGAESQRIISLIDVLWIKGTNQVIAAFEIEHTTSVYSGLLRMSDLTINSPNILFPIYIVVPEGRLDKVRRELSRPTFQTLELQGFLGTSFLGSGLVI